MPALPSSSPPLPATHPPSLSLSFSLCVDNVSANDLTALVEAPSSNWTSRDWVLYRKTIVILSQISTTLRFNKTQGWTGLCGLLHIWIEEKNQVCFLLSNGRKKKWKGPRENGCHYFTQCMWAKVQPQVVLLIISHKYALINGDNKSQGATGIIIDIFIVIFIIMHMAEYENVAETSTFERDCSGLVFVLLFGTARGALIVLLWSWIDLVCQNELFLRLVSYAALLGWNGLRRSCSWQRCIVSGSQ